MKTVFFGILVLFGATSYAQDNERATVLLQTMDDQFVVLQDASDAQFIETQSELLVRVGHSNKGRSARARSFCEMLLRSGNGYACWEIPEIKVDNRPWCIPPLNRLKPAGCVINPNPNWYGRRFKDY